jgi:hypothetical protein
MPCRSCQSENQRKLDAEVYIHFPGLTGLDQPSVWVFPELLVCLNCGFMESSIPEAELRLLAKNTAIHGAVRQSQSEA